MAWLQAIVAGDEPSFRCLLPDRHVDGILSKIAWSRFGCIASVASNGKRLDLRLLIRSPKTGEWRLQKPTSV